MKEINTKHIAFISAVALVCGLVLMRFVGLVEQKADFLKGIGYASDHLLDFSSAGMPVLSTSVYGICSFVFVVCIIYMLYFRWASKGTFRRGEEHGSSRWATKDEISKFGDFDNPINNVILAKDVRMRYTRGPDFLYERTRNVLIVGGSGSGKTRGYVKPNLMQIPSEENGRTKTASLSLEEQRQFARSYLVTDPKGVTCNETGHLFAEHGYVIKVFNTIDFDSSLCFNPLKYIRSEEDVLTFATCLIRNTTPPDAGKAGDPFWEKSETLLYQAIVNYMLTEVAPEDRNLPTMCELLDLGQIDPNTGAMSGLDILFAELETGKDYDPDTQDVTSVNKKSLSMYEESPQAANPWVQVREPQPNHPAVLAYRSFKSGAPETLQSILISCKVRLAPLRTKRIRRILERDEMELDMFGDKKMVCFAVVSATDPTYNFLFAILIWQMINELTRRGTMKYGDRGGALPVGVDLLLDEFANFFVPNFEKTIAVVRSYNIAAHIILQSLSQLKENYGEDNSATIINNCDSMVFLGGKSNETNKELEETIGQQTVTTDNTSDSHAEKNSWSQTIAQHGRALMQASEIAKMPKTDCIVLIQGANPYIGPKFDVTNHVMYEWIDPGKGRRFDRTFNFGAYMRNPTYYLLDGASLSITSEAKLYLSSPANIRPPQGSAYTVLVQSRITNSGTDTAYNLKGMIEFDVFCASNYESERFPLMEPFGTASGLRFLRGDTFSNKLVKNSSGDYVDNIEWLDNQGCYELHGIDLQPGETVIYSTALTVSVEEMRSKMIQVNANVDTCEFEFSYNIYLESANGGVVKNTKAPVLKVRTNGMAKIESQ